MNTNTETERLHAELVALRADHAELLHNSTCEIMRLQRELRQMTLERDTYRDKLSIVNGAKTNER